MTSCKKGEFRFLYVPPCCFYFQLHRSCKRNDVFANGYLKKI
ncbi:MAG: hypothetical protein ACK51L_05060 [bacterium]